MKKMSVATQRKVNGGKGILVRIWEWLWGTAKKNAKKNDYVGTVLGR